LVIRAKISREPESVVSSLLHSQSLARLKMRNGGMRREKTISVSSAVSRMLDIQDRALSSGESRTPD